MYTIDTLPAHVIAPDESGTLYLVPNIPGGWRKRQPYRGHVAALTPMDATTARVMRRHLGIPDAAPLASTSDVAAELGIIRQRVLQLAASRGVGQLVGRSLVFTAADIDAMRERKPGRPSNL